MNLLRQWPLLESVLSPILLTVKSQPNVAVWSLGTVDDALAVALVYLHCVAPRRGGDVRVFHAGIPPAWESMAWRQAEIRALPPTRWITPPAATSRRWTPRPELLDKVVLQEPQRPVDLIAVAGEPAATPWRAALSRLRRGGYLFFGAATPALSEPGGEVERVDEDGHLYRRFAGGIEPAASAAGSAEEGPTLAQHDQEARLVASYMNLARSLARRFAHRGERLDDLEQVAALALVKAAGRYSSDRGPFGPFAASTIAGELKRHFRDRLLMVRVPRSVQELYLDIRAARDELFQTLGASPSIRQIGEYLDTSEESVLAAIEAAENSWPTSLDVPRSGEDQTVTEVPAIDAGFDRSLDRQMLSEALPRLSPVEKLVVRRTYFDGCTQRQVATELGVSQMQISRVMARAMAQLRESMCASAS